MSDPDGFYKLLGVTPGSDFSDVKKAYHKLLKEYHPDNSTRANAVKKIEDEEEREQKMKELEDFCYKINEAQSYLADEDNKRRYDKGIGKEGPKMDAGNIFEFFGMNQSRRRKVEDTIFKVEISLKEAFTGVKKKYKINRKVVCKSCSGIGAEREEVCNYCNGRGAQPTQVFGGFIIGEKTCKECKGMKMIAKGKKCDICNGQKRIIENKIVDLVINKGIEDGELITFENLGDEAKDYKNGDLVFKIKIKEDKRFERIGMNLVSKIEVDLLTALIGGKIYFEHINNKLLEIETEKITNFKDSIILENEGFDKKGHLFLNVEYKIPKKLDKSKLEECFKVSDKVDNKVKHTGEVEKVKAIYGPLPEREEEEEEQRGNTFSQFFFG